MPASCSQNQGVGVNERSRVRQTVHQTVEQIIQRTGMPRQTAVNNRWADSDGASLHSGI